MSRRPGAVLEPGAFKRAVERYWRDARLTTIFEGPSEIQRKIISDRLIGVDKVGYGSLQPPDQHFCRLDEVYAGWTKADALDLQIPVSLSGYQRDCPKLDWSPGQGGSRSARQKPRSRCYSSLLV